MRDLIHLSLGVFAVMALSNAIVPVLPGYASGTALQGEIYSAYFLGAFVLTLPSGILADRWGSKLLSDAGLFFTCIAGIMLIFSPMFVVVLAARLLEGIGAGMFVAAALTYVNRQPGHQKRSGWFLAALNIGLIAGLILSGWLAGVSGYKSAGLALFSAIALLSLVVSIVIRPLTEVPSGNVRTWSSHIGSLPGIIRNYIWLWFSSVVLIGITGAVTAIYPQFSGASPEVVGLEIAAMSGATAITVIVVSKWSFAPVPVLRLAALLSAGAVIACFFTPLAFIVLGALAGVVMIAQLTYLASAGRDQGTYMGLFDASSYLGMTVLPFIAGIVAQVSGFFMAFLVTAVFALFVAVTIGFCRSCPVPSADTT
ncbi:MAG TPA: MFS transporter [Methanoregulaceae archaeon]|nr:MFS transporter [Methanoregulaceae archaeon]